MAKLIKIGDKSRLTIEEVFALSTMQIGFTPKFKGEIFMDFIDTRTGEVVKHKHIKNTRTWEFKSNVFSNDRVLASNGYVFISNDDGDWHVHKNMVRCTYQNNGGNFFTAVPTRTVTPATYIYQFVAQFQAAPAGTTKTINCVGICGYTIAHGTNSRFGGNVIAATRIPGAGETQDEYTIVNITYKLTCTV